MLWFLNYLWDVAAKYTFTGLANSEASHQDHAALMGFFEARDVDGVIATMSLHRGISVEAVARWEARERGESRKPNALSQTSGLLPAASH